MDLQSLISALQLQPHPEGGYYRELYRSEERISAEALPERYRQPRVLHTGIYFLLTSGNFSAFHRIDSDEYWHFYQGGPLLVHLLHPENGYSCIRLGTPEQQGVFQSLVPAGTWFASECAAGVEWSLVGCNVAPGFEFDGFELASAQQLTQQFPEHAALIHRLCRS